METLSISAGQREVLQLAVRRRGISPAGPVQFKVGAGLWVTLEPLDPAPNPAVYEMLIAAGSDVLFPDPHPSGTTVVTEAVIVYMRPISGRQFRTDGIVRIEVA